MNAVEYCLLHGLKLAGPEHPAILCAQESLSYGALAARVSQFATGLREVGVRPNDRVGMLMLDTPDLIALHLGAVAAGAIAVAMSNRATAAELAQILAIVRPAAARKAAGWHECLTALISAGPIQFPRYVPRRRGGVAGTRASGRFHLMPFGGAGG
jgi:acyl-CoA synthetase (AMP-forming)/AMP-acid ligase II